MLVFSSATGTTHELELFCTMCTHTTAIHALKLMKYIMIYKKQDVQLKYIVSLCKICREDFANYNNAYMKANSSDCLLKKLTVTDLLML